MSTTSNPGTGGTAPSPDESFRPGADTTASTPGPRPGRWVGDVGLLALRLTLATSFIGHGAQKFGAFGGPGIEGFAAGTLTGYGFRVPVVLAYVNGLTELLGGILVAIGLLTPLAATGLMAVMIDSTLLKFGNGFFFTNPGGYEVDIALGGLAAGIVLLGAGRLAIDARIPAVGRPTVRAVLLIVGIAAALAVYLLLR